MAKLIGISGSLRKASFNTGLLRAAAAVMPSGSTLQLRTIHGIPLYDGDLEEQSGIPAAVVDLKDAIAAADGVIIATPEYNNSLPGVFKNAVDWLTRPPADIKRVWGNKPVAIIGATVGGFGTILAQDAWAATMRHLGVRLWFGDRLLVSGAAKVFDAHGELTDEKTRENLKRFVTGFAEFCR